MKTINFPCFAKIQSALFSFALAASLISSTSVAAQQPSPTKRGQPGQTPVAQVSAGHSSVGLPAAAKQRVMGNYGRMPLNFEANQGQAEGQVKFLSKGSGYTLFLTSTEAVLVLSKSEREIKGPEPSESVEPEEMIRVGARPHAFKSTVLGMKLVGANPQAHVTGLGALSGKVNYFLGNDSKQWRTGIPTYAKVRYKDVYPGIDLVYYGNQRQLEFDFVVAAGADPKHITLSFEGADQLEVDAQGDLVVHTGGGQIRQRKPLVYQEADGLRHEISGGYVLRDEHQVGFEVAAYDADRPLIIDPVLVYSTYLGGNSSDFGYAIAVDATGSAYVTGETASSDFPTANSLQPDTRGGLEIFVVKLNPTGSALVYSTFIGGSGSEWGKGIALDTSGNAYVTGITTSDDFPTVNPLKAANWEWSSDAFVFKLNSEGSSLVYSTYLGGPFRDWGEDIAVDAAGCAYVTGLTDLFPVFPGALQQTFGGGQDAFVAKLSPAGSSLVYSTYLGGSRFDIGFGIAVDAAGNAYVTGTTGSSDFPTTANALQPAHHGGMDAFVAKLNPGGTALLYSTYLGGSAGDNDDVSDIAVDSAGNAYVTGITTSFNFPTTANSFQPVKLSSGPDAFVAKLNPTGSALLYSTYLGGTGIDAGFGIAVDASGNAYVAGITVAFDFPTVDPLQTVHHRGWGDAFVAKLNPTGSALLYSSYLGGSSHDVGSAIAVDTSGNAYMTGWTASSDFPTANPLQSGGPSYEVFVAKIGSALEVHVDIRPQACPNPLNVRSRGVLPVAILGAPDFGVNAINVGSILLQGVSPLSAAVEDVSRPVVNRQEVCDCTTEGADGFADLILKFDTDAIKSVLGAVNDGDEVTLTLTGRLNDGTPFEGRDCVVILAKGR